MQKHKKYIKHYFSIENDEIMIDVVKAKEVIDLEGAVIQIVHEPSDSKKDMPQAARMAYKFSISVPTGKKSITKGGQFKELRFGCETAEQRQEWVACL